jgi:hypothetical protein
MEALSMLAPRERGVRSKLQLFLRLWVARQKYEGLRPFGGESSARKIRFHLEQLQACWDHVVEVQKSLAMEVEHFSPMDKFELIYVISAFIDRELTHKDNTLIGLQAKWSAYQVALRRLNYEMNQYDFADRCQRCQAIIADLCKPEEPEAAEIIPFLPQRLARARAAAPELKMAEEQDQSDSGSSKYSPGGRFSYSRK